MKPFNKTITRVETIECPFPYFTSILLFKKKVNLTYCVLSPSFGITKVYANVILIHIKYSGKLEQ